MYHSTSTPAFDLAGSDGGRPERQAEGAEVVVELLHVAQQNHAEPDPSIEFRADGEQQSVGGSGFIFVYMYIYNVYIYIYNIYIYLYLGKYSFCVCVCL